MFANYLLNHGAGFQTHAADWLHDLFGPEPKEGVQRTLFAKELPIFEASKTPVNEPFGEVPLTFEHGVRLILFCDLTGALAIPDGNGWQVYPDVISLGSSMSLGPSTSAWKQEITLRAEANTLALHAKTPLNKGDLNLDDFAQFLQTRVDAVLSDYSEDTGVLDPRAHSSSKGARFAPFSPYPKVEPQVQERLMSFLDAFAHMMEGTPHSLRRISVSRPQTLSPWKNGKDQKWCYPSLEDGRHSKPISKWLKKTLLNAPNLVPENMLHSRSGSSLVHWAGHPSDLSAHQRLKSMQILQSFAPGIELP
jgi:hypothetical protein